MNANRSNDFATAGYPSGDGAIVWQPVMMAPNAVKTDGRKSRYSGMQTIAINVFSAISIFLGVASIGVQIAALVIYATKLYNFVWFAGDVVGAGIWAGSFYVIAGSLGIASTHKRTTALLVWTVVLSGLSIASSIAASTLSGMAASNEVYYMCYSYVEPSSLCSTWISLEWTLMGISVSASISSIVLIVLTSVALCCSRRSDSAARNQQIHYGTAMGQQPIYFKPQPMQQQQYQPQQPNYPTAYVSQQPQMQLVATPTAPPAQEKQAPNTVPVAQQQQPAKANESVDVRPVE